MVGPSFLSRSVRAALVGVVIAAPSAASEPEARLHIDVDGDRVEMSVRLPRAAVNDPAELRRRMRTVDLARFPFADGCHDDGRAFHEKDDGMLLVAQEFHCHGPFGRSPAWLELKIFEQLPRIETLAVVVKRPDGGIHTTRVESDTPTRVLLTRAP